jgi:hypothetical protein
MSKNMTRKSLAIVSAVSLAVIGLSAPAGAAGLSDKSFVSLEPSSGDNYSVVASAGKLFGLTANEATTIDGGGAVKILVTDADAAVFPTANTTGVAYEALEGAAYIEDWTRTDGTVTLTFDDADHGLVVGEIIEVSTAIEEDAVDADTTVVVGYYTLTDVDGVTAQFVDGLDDDDVAVGGATDGNFLGEIMTSGIVRDEDDNSFVIDSGVNDGTADEEIELWVGSDATAIATLTAWVDSNDKNGIDSTEYTSVTRTVAFHGVDDLTASVAWTARIGVKPAAVFTFAEAINWDQTVAGDFLATWTNGGGATLDTPTYAVDADEETLTVSEDTVLAAGSLGITLTNADGSDIAAFSTEVVDNDVEYMTVAVSETADSTNGAAPAGSASHTATVRSDEDTTVTVTVYNTDDEPVSGVIVNVDEYADNVTSKDVYKVNGEEVAADGTFDAFTLTSNSNGQISFVVDAIDDTTNGDEINLAFSADGITAALAADDGKDALAKIDIAWEDTVYTASVVNIVDAKTTDSANAASDGIRSNSLPVQVRVVDQWVSTPANSEYRVEATVVQDSESESAFVAVVNGSASFSVSDNADADGGLITATLDLQEYSTGTASFADYDPNFAKVYVQPFTSSIAGRVTFTDDEPAAEAVGTDALVAANTKLGASTPDVGDDVSLSGTVKNNANGATVKGASITLSGPSNLLFSADGLYSFGSITAIVGDAGDFTVRVYSTVSGEFTVTATSLGGSDEATVEFDSPLQTAGENLVVSVSNLSAGKTGTVSGSLTDQFGNDVDTIGGDAQLDITYTGPGFVVGSLPTNFDENGEFSFNVLMGANDVVSGSVVVRYDKDDNAVFTDDEDLIVTKALAPAADTKVNAGSFKGYVALYAKGYEGQKMSAIVAGKWIVVASLATDFERVVRFTGAGYDIVATIYIDGVMIDTFNITTK